MNKFTWGHTVSWQTPKHTTYIGLPAPSQIDYCFLCSSTPRGIETFKNLGESLYLSGPWVFCLSNEKVGTDHIRPFWIPGLYWNQLWSRETSLGNV